MDKFDQIDLLQKDLDGYLPFGPLFKRKLDEKFRLEFNYNSNHIEGNTITYIDAKSLLLKDLVTNAYTMRELEELKAHDAAFALISKWAMNDERDLIESDLRQLNEIILVKPYYKDAIDASGQPTRKLIQVGQYKSTPNSVILQNGEIFYYADPIEVPAKMQELFDWYNHEKENLHPLTLATIFHHKFVLIHPFDDGNGRISRLVVNYILMRADYPPIVIKSVEKRKYLEVLSLADIGNFGAFIDFMADQLIWSLELSIKAANGESIEESNDWEMELSLLSKKVDTIPIRKSKEIFLERFSDSILPVIKEIISKAELNFLQYYESYNYTVDIDNSINLKPYVDGTFSNIENISYKFIDTGRHQTIMFTTSLDRYKKDDLNVFYTNITIFFVLDSYQYKVILYNHGKTILEKKYNEPLTFEEIDLVVNEWGKAIVNDIKTKLDKN